jgi:hypothetical protein
MGLTRRPERNEEKKDRDARVESPFRPLPGRVLVPGNRVVGLGDGDEVRIAIPVEVPGMDVERLPGVGRNNEARAE